MRAVHPSVAACASELVAAVSATSSDLGDSYGYDPQHAARRGTMRARTAALLIAAAVLAGCAEPQEKIAEDCAAKVAQMKDPPRHAKSDPRPPECEGLNSDDYVVIVTHRAYNDKDVFDEEGVVDPDKIDKVDE
jgi:hypothetical protein